MTERETHYPYRDAQPTPDGCVETNPLTRTITWVSEHAWPLLLSAYATASTLVWAVLVIGHFTTGLGHGHWAPTLVNALPVLAASGLALFATAEPREPEAPAIVTIAVLAWVFALTMAVGSTTVQVFG